jgi:hypothetical protein
MSADDKEGKLREAVNSSSGECLPECDSIAHADGCEYVDIASGLVKQQEVIVDLKQQLEAAKALTATLERDVTACHQRSRARLDRAEKAEASGDAKLRELRVAVIALIRQLDMSTWVEQDTGLGHEVSGLKALSDVRLLAETPSPTRFTVHGVCKLSSDDCPEDQRADCRRSADDKEARFREVQKTVSLKREDLICRQAETIDRLIKECHDQRDLLSLQRATIQDQREAIVALREQAMRSADDKRSRFTEAAAEHEAAIAAWCPTCGKMPGTSPFCSACGNQEPAPESKPSTGLLAAAINFTARIWDVEMSEPFKAVWTFNQMHNGPYNGLTYLRELDDLRQAIAAEKAKGVTAENQSWEILNLQTDSEDLAKIRERAVGLYDFVRDIASGGAVTDGS